MMLNNWVNEERNVDINISEIVFKFYPIMQSLEWLIRSKYIWKKKDNRYTIQKACYLSWNYRSVKKFLDSKLVLKVYSKPSWKNTDFVSLPGPILPGWLKILQLIK
jgi:hypothetical protein